MPGRVESRADGVGPLSTVGGPVCGHRLERVLHGLLVLAHELGQVVGDGHVQPVDGAAPEVGARGGQLLELEQRVEAEEVAVRVRVREVVPRDVGQGAETLVDVVVLGVVDDVVGHLLLVAEEGFVVVVRGQVAVHHFRVVAYSHLQISATITLISQTGIGTAA